MVLRYQCVLEEYERCPSRVRLYGFLINILIVNLNKQNKIPNIVILTIRIRFITRTSKTQVSKGYSRTYTTIFEDLAFKVMS